MKLQIALDDVTLEGALELVKKVRDYIDIIEIGTPFVTTAPRRFRSTNSLYSAPEPNVPEATITGFFSSTPARFTFVFNTVPPPVH